MYTGSVHPIAYSADEDVGWDDVARCDGQRKSIGRCDEEKGGNDVDELHYGVLVVE